MTKLNIKHTLKKHWHKPNVIVLVRSNSEEKILVNCKTDVVAGGGPSTTDKECETLARCGTSC